MRLEVPFEGVGLGVIGEPQRDEAGPWDILGCVSAFAAVVLGESPLDVARHADIGLVRS